MPNYSPKYKGTFLFKTCSHEIKIVMRKAYKLTHQSGGVENFETHTTK
jgi:hypothetical protein